MTELLFEVTCNYVMNYISMNTRKTLCCSVACTQSRMELMEGNIMMLLFITDCT